MVAAVTSVAVNKPHAGVVRRMVGVNVELYKVRTIGFDELVIVHAHVVYVCRNGNLEGLAAVFVAGNAFHIKCGDRVVGAAGKAGQSRFFIKGERILIAGGNVDARGFAVVDNSGCAADREGLVFQFGNSNLIASFVNLRAVYIIAVCCREGIDITFGKLN